MVTWREQLAFAPLETGERSEEIARRLRHAIELGVLENGSQLPSETDLATMMGVSTITLRAGLAELRHLGLLETKRGRGGGSFVRANEDDFTAAQQETLARYSLDDLRDIREYRAFLAGSSAAAAAERWRLMPLQRLRSLGDAIRSARTPADLARADSRFHMELSAACRSVRLTREEMSMQAEVGALIWSHTPNDNSSAKAAFDHGAIVQAISASDATLARKLAEEHARSEINRLIDLRMAKDMVRVTTVSSPAQFESAVSAVFAKARHLNEIAAAAVAIVEQAALGGLDGQMTVTTGEFQGVYEATHQALAHAAPELWSLGFTSDATYFGEAELIGCVASGGPESVQRLAVDWTDYDFETAPWWPTQDSADGPIFVTGAFIDASGSNEYIATFSKRVSLAGRMIGVVSADVLIRQLQNDFEPLLLTLPAGTCILDQHGVVIATNAGSLIGEVLMTSSSDSNRIDLPGVPWHLYFTELPPTLLAGTALSQTIT